MDEKNVEFDVSKIAWQTYNLMYNCCFDKQIIKKGKRPYVSCESINGIELKKIDFHGKKENVTLDFSGETDFSFKKGFAYSRLDAYKDLLKDNFDYQNQLEICQKLMYSIVNISLMPQTGNLQGVKGNVTHDRLDTFIYLLDNYYKGIDNLLFNYSSAYNAPYLKTYLDSFENIYCYCKNIYLMDKDITNKFIQSGKKPIVSKDDVMTYIELAYKFWNARYEFLQNKELSDDMKKELEEVNKLLNEICPKKDCQ